MVADGRPLDEAAREGLHQGLTQPVARFRAVVEQVHDGAQGADDAITLTLFDYARLK